MINVKPKFLSPLFLDLQFIILFIVAMQQLQLQQLIRLFFALKSLVIFVIFLLQVTVIFWLLAVIIMIIIIVISMHYFKAFLIIT